MFYVGDRVLIVRNGTRRGTVIYVKGYDIKHEFFVVTDEYNVTEHYKENELIKEGEI